MEMSAADKTNVILFKCSQVNIFSSNLFIE